MQLNQKIDYAIVPITNFTLATRSSCKTKYRKKWQSLIKITLGAVGLLLILGLPAMACGVDIALHVSFLFALPAIASFFGYGLPLVAIILIEAFILHKRESIPSLHACVLAALGNGFYLVASLVNSIFVTGFLPLSVIGSIISAAMCLSFCQRTGYFKRLSKGMFYFLIFLLFIGLSFAHLFLAVFYWQSDPIFLYASKAGLILIGFIFGFVAKGYAIARLLREKRPTLASTVMSMHVGSFPIVAIAYYLMPR